VTVVGLRPVFPAGLELAPDPGFTTREQALDYLHDVAKRYQDRMPHVSATAVEAIEPATAIVQLLEPGAFDLVAMATHGRSGLSRLLLGSVAEKVLRRTFRPVLLYRPRSVRLPSDPLDGAFRIYG
jgi:nucleotide-binding universal stress UspA family protein